MDSISSNMVSKVLLQTSANEAAKENSEKMNIPQVLQLSKDAYRYAYNNDSRMNEKLVEFYKEGIKNPSLAKIIANHATLKGTEYYGDKVQEDIGSLRGNPWTLIKDYLKNVFKAAYRLKAAQKTFSINYFYSRFEDEYKKLYGKTYKLREKLIIEQRVLFDKIVPCLPKSIKKTVKYAKYF